MRAPAIHACVPIVLLTGALGAAEPAVKARAGSPPAAPVTAPAGPSSEEVVVARLLDRHRADRQRGEQRIEDALRSDGTTELQHEWHHQTGKVGALPALVFDPRLNHAARALLTAGTKPTPGQPTAIGDALAAVGYPASGTGEVLALLASDAPTLDAAYVQACTQVVGSITNTNKAGTHPVFAGMGLHRAIFRTVGAAVGGSAGHWSLVLILAPSSATKLAGGTIYADRNHNGRYDLGEGVAGAVVTVGATTLTTGAGGAWWATPAATDTTARCTTDDASADLPLGGDGGAAIDPVIAD